MKWIDLVKTLPIYIAALLAVIWLTFIETELDDRPLVRLEQGLFRGVVDEGSKLESFRGIRYALPPIKERRFRRAQPVWEGPLPDRLNPHNRTTTDGKFDASFYGPSCPQFIPPAFMAYRPPTPLGATQEISSEDCLSVNVFRPAHLRRKVPVLVWIYGGAWLMGADFPYDHTSLVEQSITNKEPIILVTFNYRIGAFGFLSGKAMKEQAKAGNVDLNVGLHDQRAALRWIKRNIEQFGGDPDRVTVAGESAGGQSISYHLLSQVGEKDEKLFHQAIMQSGGSGMAMIPADGARHEHYYRTLLSSTTCSQHTGSYEQIRCLQNLSSAAMAAANVRTFTYVLGITSQASWRMPVFFPFWPTLDEDFIKESPYDQWMRGDYKDVPMILGNVLDEGTLFTPHDIHNETILIPWVRRSLLSADKLTQSERVHTMKTLLKAYPDVPSQGSPFASKTEDRLLPGPDNQYKRVAAAMGDIAFQAPRRYQIRQHAKLHAQGKKKYPAWNYLLTEGGARVTAAQGVAHGVDNDFLFKPMAQYLFFRPPPEYRIPGSRWDNVGKVMRTAWIGFVNRGHPNRAGVPKWPYYAPLGSEKRLPLCTLQIQAHNTTIIPDDWREEAITKTLIEDGIVRKALAY